MNAVDTGREGACDVWGPVLSGGREENHEFSTRVTQAGDRRQEHGCVTTCDTGLQGQFSYR